jgi:hypothetical protein
MLDTVTLRGDWPTRIPFPGARTVRLDDASPVKVRIDASGRILQRVECSLPRLLFGHNGRVLENQGEINEAVAKLHSELNAVARISDVSGWRIWRADMAWMSESAGHPR